MIKNTLRFIGAIIIGLLLIQTIAWTKGQKNIYIHTIEEKISPRLIKDPSPNEEYFYESIVVKTVIPSSIPLLFESTYDTLPSNIESRYAR